MASLCSNSLSYSPLNPSSFSLHDHHSMICLKNRKLSLIKSKKSDHQDPFHGKYYRSEVDESMIILRRRIHEMKMIERNYEPPSDWNEWEKNIYTRYDFIIYDMIRILQAQLMNTRPSLALGIISLMTFTLPYLTFMGLFQFLETSKEILSGIHIH
ncbi:hypothetical protein ACFE04_020066 [Oxalis oulophora]